MLSIGIDDIVVSVAPLITSSLALSAAHWFPWNNGTRQPLERTTAYTVGTSIVVGVPVATIFLVSALGMEYGQLFWAGLLLANAVASGITVKLAYWIDSRLAATASEVHHAQKRG